MKHQYINPWKWPVLISHTVKNTDYTDLSGPPHSSCFFTFCYTADHHKMAI